MSSTTVTATTVTPKPGRNGWAEMLYKLDIAIHAMDNSNVQPGKEYWIQLAKETLTDAKEAIKLGFPDIREMDYWLKLVETNKKFADKAYPEDSEVTRPEEVYSALSIIQWHARQMLIH